MPTIVTHGFIALAMGRFAFQQPLPLRFWWLCVACSILPDIDVIGHVLGIPYGHVLGHRGITHSLLFALFTSLVVVRGAFHHPQYISMRLKLIVFFFIVTASHGLFDAMTDGGRGIAFLAPFDSTRYFLPFSPIQVSSIGLKSFIMGNGKNVILNELLWLILPFTCLFSLGYWRYHKFRLKNNLTE